MSSRRSLRNLPVRQSRLSEETAKFNSNKSRASLRKKNSVNYDENRHDVICIDDSDSNGSPGSVEIQKKPETNTPKKNKNSKGAEIQIEIVNNETVNVENESESDNKNNKDNTVSNDVNPDDDNRDVQPIPDSDVIVITPNKSQAIRGADFKDPTSTTASLERIFYVEKILDMRIVRGRRMFLLKWDGFPDSENSWEPETNINSPNMIEDFLATQKHSKQNGSDISKDVIDVDDEEVNRSPVHNKNKKDFKKRNIFADLNLDSTSVNDDNSIVSSSRSKNSSKAISDIDEHTINSSNSKSKSKQQNNIDADLSLEKSTSKSLRSRTIQIENDIECITVNSDDADEQSVVSSGAVIKQQTEDNIVVNLGNSSTRSLRSRTIQIDNEVDCISLHSSSRKTDNEHDTHSTISSDVVLRRSSRFSSGKDNNVQQSTRSLRSRQIVLDTDSSPLDSNQTTSKSTDTSLERSHRSLRSRELDFLLASTGFRSRSRKRFMSGTSEESAPLNELNAKKKRKLNDEVVELVDDTEDNGANGNKSKTTSRKQKETGKETIQIDLSEADDVDANMDLSKNVIDLNVVNENDTISMNSSNLRISSKMEKVVDVKKFDTSHQVIDVDSEEQEIVNNDAIDVFKPTKKLDVSKQQIILLQDSPEDGFGYDEQNREFADEQCEEDFNTNSSKSKRVPPINNESLNDSERVEHNEGCDTSLASDQKEISNQDDSQKKRRRKLRKNLFSKKKCDKDANKFFPQNLPQTVQEIFQVETILKMKIMNGKRYFYLKWEGFPDTENSWEPETNLECPDLVEKFLEDLREQEKADRELEKEKENQSKAVKDRRKKRDQSPELSMLPSDIAISDAKFIRNCKYREPERVLAAGYINDEMMFLIKWKNIDWANLVPAERAFRECPRMVYNYFMKHSRWVNPDGSSTEVPHDKLYFDEEDDVNDIPIRSVGRKPRKSKLADESTPLSKLVNQQKSIQKLPNLAIKSNHSQSKMISSDFMKPNSNFVKASAGHSRSQSSILNVIQNFKLNKVDQSIKEPVPILTEAFNIEKRSYDSRDIPKEPNDTSASILVKPATAADPIDSIASPIPSRTYDPVGYPISSEPTHLPSFPPPAMAKDPETQSNCSSIEILDDVSTQLRAAAKTPSSYEIKKNVMSKLEPAPSPIHFSQPLSNNFSYRSASPITPLRTTHLSNLRPKLSTLNIHRRPPNNRPMQTNIIRSGTPALVREYMPPLQPAPGSNSKLNLSRVMQNDFSLQSKLQSSRSFSIPNNLNIAATQVHQMPNHIQYPTLQAHSTNQQQQISSSSYDFQSVLHPVLPPQGVQMYQQSVSVPQSPSQSAVFQYQSTPQQQQQPQQTYAPANGSAYRILFKQPIQSNTSNLVMPQTQLASPYYGTQQQYLTGNSQYVQTVPNSSHNYIQGQQPNFQYQSYQNKAVSNAYLNFNAYL